MTWDSFPGAARLMDKGNVTIIALILPFIGPVTNLAWIFAGVWLQRIFKEHEKTMNLIMAGALILRALSLIVM